MTYRETSLVEFFQFLWKSRAIIVVCTVLGLLGGIGYLYKVAPKYRVSYTVAPVAQTSPGGGSSGIGGSGGLQQAAQIAGINLGGGAGGISRIALYKETVTSYRLAQELIAETDFLQRVFAGQWDSETKSWIREANLGGPISWIRRGLESVAGIERNVRAPDARDLANYLDTVINVKRHEEVNLYTVSYTGVRPRLAKNLLTTIHQTAEKIMRERALNRTEQNIKHVRNKLPEISNSVHRQSLIQLLLEEERRRMVAEIGDAYAAKIFDPVTVSTGAISPAVLRIFVGAGAFGLIAGVGVAWFAWPVLQARRRRTAKTEPGRET